MPTGQRPTIKLFEDLVAFARQNNVLLIHDNPYSFILNDEPMSILQVEGSKDLVIELNSLSKSHNMAGWRIGMLMAKAQHVDNVLRFKSNMDSGMFLPLQLAAAKALSLPPSWYEKINNIYKDRKKAVETLLNGLGCPYSKEQSGLFMWAKVPDGIQDGFAFSDLLLYQAGVFVTPGGIFGSAGDHYIRVSLCAPVEKIDECTDRIQKAGLIKSIHHV
jgi:aspartate/methionine/tyrosine aminotransferase